MEAAVGEAPTGLERAHNLLLELVRHWPWSDAVTARRKVGRPLGCKDKEPRNRRGQGKRPRPPANHALLTEAYIDRVPPSIKSRVVWDTRQPGFGARIHASKPGDPTRAVYVIAYQRSNGRRVIDTIGPCSTMGLPEARRIAKIMHKKVRGGLASTKSQYRGSPFVPLEASEKVPVDQLSPKPQDTIDRHLDWFKVNRARSTWVVRRSMFSYHIKAWADQFESVRDITQDDVFDLFNSKPAASSDAVLNNIYGAIKAWFKYMREVERITDTNVTVGMGQPRPYSERNRWLNDDEIRWFWLACTTEGYPHGDRYKLLLLTAQRPSEIREIPLSELHSYHDLREWHLAKERAKSRRDHIVPISDFAAELTDSILARGNNNYLFTIDDQEAIDGKNEPRVRVARLMEAYRAQELLQQRKNPSEGSIPPWDQRDLRRTAATIMARLKHPLHIVDKVLNHGGGHTGTGRTQSMVTRVYVKHEFLDERRAALQDLGEYVRKLVQA